MRLLFFFQALKLTSEEVAYFTAPSAFEEGFSSGDIVLGVFSSLRVVGIVARPDTSANQVVITDIVENSSAHLQGELKQGDLIILLNGSPLQQFNSESTFTGAILRVTVRPRVTPSTTKQIDLIVGDESYLSSYSTRVKELECLSAQTKVVQHLNTQVGVAESEMEKMSKLRNSAFDEVDLVGAVYSNYDL